MWNTYLGSMTPLNIRRKKEVFFFLPTDMGKPLSGLQTSLIPANYGFVTGNSGIESCWGDHRAEPSLLVGGCVCTNGSSDNIKLDLRILGLELCYSFNSVTDSSGALKVTSRATTSNRNRKRPCAGPGWYWGLGGGGSADGQPCKPGREGEIGQREEPK